MPYIGRSTDGFGVRNRFLYLASADDTSVSGADANGATLTFTDGAYVDVYLNGVLLKTGTDYNTNTANTIAGLSALASNDEVTVIVYDVFTVGDMVSATSGGTFIGAVTLTGGITGDLDLNTDSAVIKFGADDDVTITHDPDDGLILKSTATGDDNPFLLTLQTGETDLAANDVIGKIAFQAPDEDTGTDAILVSGAIQARAEGDHSASSNATSLDFMTGASEAATTKMSLSSGGHLNVASGGITIDTVGQALGVGTNNPGHAIEVKHTAPEIMLEETSSGGSKRISMGVTSGGQPFINAEQSGGSIAMNMTGTEVAKFNSNGLSFPSGKGLDFSATGDGSGANQNEILDDYEEGTWTPALVSGGSGSISVNSSRYTRIGNLVYAGCYINFSNLPNNSSAFQMSGLPFAVIGSSNYHGGGAFTFAGTFNWAGLNAFPAFTPYSGTSQFYLHKTSTTTTILYSEVTSLTALIFSIIYITS